MNSVKVNIENGAAFKFWGSVIIIEDIDTNFITYKDIESGKVSDIANTEENRAAISRKPVNNPFNEARAGEGATITTGSDARAYEVLEVSKDGKKAIIQRYKRTRTDKNGMSESQSYEYGELIGKPFEIRFRHGAWKEMERKVWLTPRFWDLKRDIEANQGEAEAIKFEESFIDFETDEYIHKPGTGFSEEKITWNKISIRFGVKAERFDYSF